MPKGNLLSTITPSPDGIAPGSTTSFTYDNKGQLLTITDSLGDVTAMTYTTTGLVATVTDAQGNVTHYEYDARGNRTAVLDALNNRSTFTYDARNRLTQITYPDTTSTSFAYDTRGRRTSVTDQNNKVTQYTYDDADRLTSVTDAANNVTSYAYDAENNLVSITDAMSRTTAFAYDAYGRVTQTTFPSSLAETYAYDAVGNLSSKTDRKSQTISYTYDALDQLTQKSYPDSTAVNYTYDATSHPTQVTDPSGIYVLTYDRMGRLTGTNTQYSFLTGRTFANLYTYDSASNRTGFTDPEGGTTSYSYDALNRMTGLNGAIGGQFTLGYDNLSRRTSLARPNGVSTAYNYDSQWRLLSILHQSSGSTIDGVTYTYDNARNRTSKLNHLTGITESYAYDAIYELTQVVQGANTTESYTYDQAGNRLTSLGVSPYSYNNSNQLTSTLSAFFTFDNNGNTLTKVDSTGSTSYAWDFENRLTSVTLPGSGGTVTFKYDAFGRRAQKISATGTVVYVYDGANVAEETDGAGAVLARYAQGGSIDEPLAESRAGATAFYDADGLGSLTSLSASSGSLVSSYTYDAFGKTASSVGSLINPFRYAGRELDQETGLYYYRARYYDPSTGRFLTEDPIQFRGGSNFYRYVRNSPLRFVDPLGLEPEDIFDSCSRCHMLCDLKSKLDTTVITSAAFVRGYLASGAFTSWTRPVQGSRIGNSPAKIANDSTQAMKDCQLAQKACHGNCNFNECAVMAPPLWWPFPPGWPFAKSKDSK